MRKQDQSLWVSLLIVVGIAVIFLGVTLAAGWSPKLGLDLDGGLSVVYQTHTPVNSSELGTIVTILGNRVNAGTTGATVQSQGKDQIAVAIPGEKNSQQILATLGNTAQLFFRPALCYANPFTLTKGQKAVDRAAPHLRGDESADGDQPRVTPDSLVDPGLQPATTSRPTPQFTTFRSTSPFNDNKNAHGDPAGTAETTAAIRVAFWARPP